jgi:hypothetical protein
MPTSKCFPILVLLLTPIFMQNVAYAESITVNSIEGTTGFSIVSPANAANPTNATLTLFDTQSTVENIPSNPSAPTNTSFSDFIIRRDTGEIGVGNTLPEPPTYLKFTVISGGMKEITTARFLPSLDATFSFSSVVALVPISTLFPGKFCLGGGCDEIIIQGMEAPVMNSRPDVWDFSNIKTFRIDIVDPDVNFLQIIQDGGTASGTDDAMFLQSSSDVTT